MSDAASLVSDYRLASINSGLASRRARNCLADAAQLERALARISGEAQMLNIE